MPRLKSGTELEALRQQQIDLAKRIRAAEAKARDKQKADHERRELLAGRAVLAHLIEQPESEAANALRAILDAAPFRPVDKTLFAAILAPPESAPVTQAD